MRIGAGLLLIAVGAILRFGISTVAPGPRSGRTASAAAGRFTQVSFDVSADAYMRFMGQYSERLATRFADLAGIHRGQRVLDVGR